MNKGIIENLSVEIPYQRIRDSPTVKYYTKWIYFEDRLNTGYAKNESDFPSIFNIESDIKLSTKYLFKNYRDIEIKPYYLKSFYNKDIDKYIEIGKLDRYHLLNYNIGIKINFKNNITTNRPLNILSISGDGYLGHHVIINTGDYSNISLNLIDYTSSENGFKTLFIEMYLGHASRLSINYLVLHDKTSPSYSQLIVKHGKNAYSNIRLLGFGGLMTRFKYIGLLNGLGSKTELYGGIIGLPEMRSDYITDVVHLSKDTISKINIRGLSKEDAYIVHRGLIKITSSAYRASSDIESNLLIFGDSEAYSIPMMEVDTGYILSTRHSTSVSKIDGEKIFYFKSRGLSDKDIEEIFLESILDFPNLLERIGVNKRELINLLT